MARFQTHIARLIRSQSLSGLTKHLDFEVQGQDGFGFVPGQWVSVKANTPEGEEVTRAYSIASPPSADGKFAFCLNRVQDGFMSNYLCDLTEGAEISFQGPFGNFTLRPPLQNTLFIATGTGIAPFRAMLGDLFASGTSCDPAHGSFEFWLLFGAQREQTLYYRAEFEQLARAHSTFHFVPTLSRGAAQWTGLRGYVQEHVQEIVGERKDVQAYICGLNRMVRANRLFLESLGWDRRAIHYERYD